GASSSRPDDITHHSSCLRHKYARGSQHKGAIPQSYLPIERFDEQSTVGGRKKKMWRRQRHYSRQFTYVMLQVQGRNSGAFFVDTMSHLDNLISHTSILTSTDEKNSANKQSCQVIYSQFGLAIHQNDHQARRRFVEWAQNEIAVVPDFHKRILFCDEAHFWLNGYVNKQNCRIWSEANPQVYVETPLHPEKLTVWCALWAGGILLQKR
ncbi:hypothetical protein TNCV_285101, partial [Trichonephila clavipes]